MQVERILNVVVMKKDEKLLFLMKRILEVNTLNYSKFNHLVRLEIKIRPPPWECQILKLDPWKQGFFFLKNSEIAHTIPHRKIITYKNVTIKLSEPQKLRAKYY